MHSKAHYCFIFENGEQKGPFPPGKVQRMLRDGEITDAALVWREGLTDWQPIGSVLPRLATIRQKEYLKFLGHPTTRDMTFEEAQSQLDALVRDNPAKKLARLIGGTCSRKREMKFWATFSAPKQNVPFQISTSFRWWKQLKRVIQSNSHPFPPTISRDFSNPIAKYADGKMSLRLMRRRLS
jgi:hypothetical protein